jgi:hypothetical protein
MASHAVGGGTLNDTGAKPEVSALRHCALDEGAEGR